MKKKIYIMLIVGVCASVFSIFLLIKVHFASKMFVSNNRYFYEDISEKIQRENIQIEQLSDIFKECLQDNISGWEGLSIMTVGLICVLLVFLYWGLYFGYLLIRKKIILSAKNDENDIA